MLTPAEVLARRVLWRVHALILSAYRGEWGTDPADGLRVLQGGEVELTYHDAYCILDDLYCGGALEGVALDDLESLWDELEGVTGERVTAFWRGEIEGFLGGLPEW